MYLPTIADPHLALARASRPSRRSRSQRSRPRRARPDVEHLGEPLVESLPRAAPAAARRCSSRPGSRRRCPGRRCRTCAIFCLHLGGDLAVGPADAGCPAGCRSRAASSPSAAWAWSSPRPPRRCTAAASGGCRPRSAARRRSASAGLASRNGSDSMSPTVPPISTMIDVVALGGGADDRLDLVGDVRNHLDRLAEILAAALLLDDRVVDPAGGEVVRPAHAAPVVKRS